MKDYDVIGFDADHCLVKYKLNELLVLLIKGELETLVKLGYPPEILEFNYEEDLAFCLNASVFDIENGIVLKLVEG